MSVAPRDIPIDTRVPVAFDSPERQRAAHAGARFLAQATLPAGRPVRIQQSRLAHIVDCLQLGSESGTSHPAFRRHLTIALGVALAQADETDLAETALATGGLAPEQVRRAKTMLDVGSQTTLEEVARAVGLSASHFARAFKASTGETPHRWNLLRRLEQAERQLATTGATLAEIALDCGFGDQSYFTRVFKRERGTTPGEVRRSALRRTDARRRR